ncbi:hypothetical protein AYO49_05520 [Verrucomicrobiaceae bacterium SCGC AG-212-N21]|nr:hypothetical protein AYO49_05520 [Verrucomicrobiaceae bacterium SCGC AG-212-N21]
MITRSPSSPLHRHWSVLASKLCALCFVLCVFAAARGVAATPGERYEEVRTNFEKSDFNRAQYLAESMMKEGHLSAELFQVMGHIRFRQGDLGRAALWYMRASLFPPPVPEIRQNLHYIHERTGNLRFVGNSFRDQFSARLTRSQWAHVTIICGWIFLFAVALFYVQSKSRALRTTLMLVRVLALAIGTIAALGWYWHPSYKKIENIAIVTAPNSKAYTAATVTSGSVSSLPPGSEVRKLEDRGSWCYVEIPVENDTRRGWVQSDVLTPFWPKEFGPGYLE